jgi:NAD(P)H dehydrogenase (quinone)
VTASRSLVAVIGGTGNTGRPLLRALARRGVPTLAILRNEARAALARDAGDIAVADLANVDALTRALRGAPVAHFIPPLYKAEEERYAANVLRAAAAAGTRRVVYHSVLHANTPRMPHHARKARIETMIREFPLAWTIVQPAMYTTTPLRFFRNEESTLDVPFSVASKFSPIDLGDLSEAVASVLAEEGHDYATYELAGGETLDFRQIGDVLANTLGRPVTVRTIDPDTALRRRNFDPQMQALARAMYAHYDEHGLRGNSRILQMLIGRKPTSFAKSTRANIDASDAT